MPILAIILVVMAVVVLQGRSSEVPPKGFGDEVTPSTAQKLAVPALQRNARNVAAATDANNLMTSLMEYVHNNSGKLPESIKANETTDEFMICGYSCGETTPSAVKLRHYKNSTSAVSFQNYSEGLQVTGLDVMYIVPKASCDDNGQIIAGSSRSLAVLYGNESGTGVVTKCVAS